MRLAVEVTACRIHTLRDQPTTPKVVPIMAMRMIGGLQNQGKHMRVL
jgi:hypothetical protein